MARGRTALNVACALVMAGSAAARGSDRLPVSVRDSRTGLGIPPTRLSWPGASEEIGGLDTAARIQLALPPSARVLDAAAPGYRPLRVKIDPGSRLPLTLWLDPISEPPDQVPPGHALRLHGHVVDVAGGRGVPGARVRAGDAETLTATDGAFDLTLPAPAPPADHEPLTRLDVTVEAEGFRTLIVTGSPLEAGVSRRTILDLTRGQGRDERPSPHRLLEPAADVPPEPQGPSLEPEAGPGTTPAGVLVPGVFAADGIRVGTSCACRSCAAVSAMSLETYVERGLDNEWLASWDSPQGGPGRHALRAGAVAYRSYGASFVVSPISPSYDICSSTCCQAYDTSSSTQSRHAARFTHSVVLSRDGVSIFRSEYSSENNSLWGANCPNPDLSCGSGFAGSPVHGWPCLADHPNCTPRVCFGHGRGMCQYGSSFWARNSNKDYQWILDHYYNDNFNPSGQRSVYVEELTGFAASANADGRLELVGRWSSDNSARRAAQPTPGSTGLTAWQSLSGGALLSSAALAPNDDGRLQVVVRGTSHQVWTASQAAPNGGWSGWTQLPGVLASSEPALARNSNGRLQVFVRGGDGRLHTAVQASPGGAFSTWTSLDGTLTSAPAVGVNQDGRLQVFARGTDDQLYTRWQTSPGSTTWAAWSSLGGQLGSKPAVARNANGTLEVFVRGVEESGPSLWRRRQNAANAVNNWGAWASLNDSATSAPAVVANTDGRVQVFSRGLTGDLRTASQTAPNAGFGAFVSLGGTCTSAPAATRNADGRVQVWVRGLDRRLYSRVQGSAGGAFTATWHDHAGSF